MRTIIVFGLGFVAGAIFFGGIPKLKKNNNPIDESQLDNKPIKIVNNPDGTITYYYKNGGVVVETTNKK